MIDSYVKTKEGRQAIRAYTVDEMHYPVIAFNTVQKNHKIVKYANEFICLDTETSKKDLLTAWVYQWAVKFGDHYIYGRKPSEIIEMMQNLCEYYHLSNEKKIILCIHNASYDLQYLKQFLKQYDPFVDYLAIDSHGIIQCDVIGFKIICSYKMTNLSLSALADNYSSKYSKAVGEIDYNIIRYQDSELTPSDWFYMFSDVASQYDGIKGFLKMQGYTYPYQAPITSTGFVRANCRKASRQAKNWHQKFYETRLDLEQYNQLRRCFMGGVCISSMYYSGLTIRSDRLRHKDFTSRYPATQLMLYMPKGKPNWYGQVKSQKELDLLCNTYFCCFVLTLWNVHIKKGVTAPCIPHSKVTHAEECLKVNGKVVYAKMLTITVCELDYKWIKRQYTFTDIAVNKMLIFERGKMPKWLRNVVFDYFKNKCTIDKSSILYQKSKNMLNGIYGMTATAILREVYKMNDICVLTKQAQSETELNASLNRYYRSYNNFMCYQYAIWTTSASRDCLYTMIEATGDNDGNGDDLTDVYKNFLYCDTDSVFYLESPENKKRMEEYTERCKQEAIEAGAYVGDKYLGLPTDEPPLRAFRGLHSKCYAMEEQDKDGEYKLNVVIAGIPKKATRWINGELVTMTNAEELGSIDNLDDGFTFKHCGGTRCVYNERDIIIENIDGHMTEYASSAVIENIEKVLSEQMYTADSQGHALHIVQYV